MKVGSVDKPSSAVRKVTILSARVVHFGRTLRMSMTTAASYKNVNVLVYNVAV